MILVIDNYDSFTFNLVQRLGELGRRCLVVRNDAVTIGEIRALKPSHIIISPGPCTPAESGISVSAVQAFAGEIPILGVCLGHQAIAAAFGGKIVRARQVMHGKTSSIAHDGKGIFSGVPNPLVAARYHSLIVDRPSLPPCLKITAWSDRGEIMGLRHEKFPIEGVQFHPESFLTPEGFAMLANFAAGAHLLPSHPD